MNVKCITVNFMKENTYVVYDETGECVIIDCGCSNESENEELSRFIQENNLKPKRLLCTHFHLDHIFGNKFIKEKYGLDAEVCEADHLLYDMIHYQFVAFSMDESSVEIPEPKYNISEGDLISFGNSTLEVIATPGHSPGGVSYYSAEDGILFSGDTLMYHATGATNLPGSRKAKLIKSIEDKLYKLPDITKVYAGHGNGTTIGEEKTNGTIKEK